MKRDCYPLTIALPDGRRAELVPGSRPPAYSLPDQADAGIDVTIPDELAQAGWYWSGSFLYQPWPEARTEAEGRGPGVAISTGTYGVPGCEAPERGPTCFDAARRLEAMRAKNNAIALAAKPPKKVKAITKTTPQPELAYEQAELML